MHPVVQHSPSGRCTLCGQAHAASAPAGAPAPPGTLWWAATPPGHQPPYATIAPVAAGATAPPTTTTTTIVDPIAARVNHRLEQDSWRVIHQMALAYPDQPSRKQRQWSRAWYEAFGHLLPCDTCRHEWQDLFARSFRNESKRGLFEWTVYAHNQANARLGKPTLTVDQAMALYL